MIPPKQFRKIGILAAKISSEKKAEDILLLDMRGTPYGLSDFILLMTANSQVHLKTLQNAIQETVEKINLPPLRKEGNRSESWSVLDYGGLIIHIMREGARQLYSLEKLWEKIKLISWEERQTADKKKKLPAPSSPFRKGRRSKKRNQ